MRFELCGWRIDPANTLTFAYLTRTDFEALGHLAGDMALLAPGLNPLASPLRHTQPLRGPPIIMGARLPVPTSTAASFMNGTSAPSLPPPLISPAEAAAAASTGLVYSPYAAAADFAAANLAAFTAANPLLAEYPPDTPGGLFAR